MAPNFPGHREEPRLRLEHLLGLAVLATLAAAVLAPPAPRDPAARLLTTPTPTPVVPGPVVVRSMSVDPIVLVRVVPPPPRAPFDWRYHNDQRHRLGPVDPTKAAEHTDIILANSIMDAYILDILAGWAIGKDEQLAVANLRQAARTYSDFVHLRAAALLKAGDLLAAQGDRDGAEESWRTVLEVAPPEEVAAYRSLAQSRLGAGR